MFTGYKIVAKRVKIGSAKSNEKCEIEHKIHNNTHSKIKKKKNRENRKKGTSLLVKFMNFCVLTYFDI